MLLTRVFLTCCLAVGITKAFLIPDLPISLKEKNTKFYSTEKCIDDLGCFPIGPEFFHPLYRPINLVPADREKIRTKFYLYTLAYPKVEFLIKAKDETLLAESGFDVTRKTKLIVHGWMDDRLFVNWMKEVKDALLLNGNHNVIVVDWSGGNGLPYTQATANTRVVGAEIAFLLQWLKDSHGLRLEDCHIMGHSLGAHIAGYAGEKLEKLGRITAMDPAEPYFQNMPPSVRIDPTDAIFVDVVHTDSQSILRGGLGMSQTVGHVDFFPNDGTSQPGCDLSRIQSIFTEGLAGRLSSFLACNHHRANDLVKDFLSKQLCLPVAYACPDWETFLDGKCADCGVKGERCAVVGEAATDHYLALKNDTRQQKFYFKTGKKAPYCLYHYQVTLQLQAGGKDQTGSLKVTLKGSRNQEVFKLLNGKKIDLNHGAIYTFLITTENNLGDIESISFRWDGSILSSIFKTRSITPESLTVSPMNHIDQKVRTSKTRKYCASKMGPLTTGKELPLNSANIC